MTSRRQFLKAGAAGATIGLAGCIGDILGGGDGVRDWLVDPRVIDQDQYGVLSAAPATLEEYSGSLDRDDWNLIEDYLVGRHDFTRILPEDVERSTLVADGARGGGYDVLTGSYDPGTLDSHLTREDYFNVTEYEGYEIYLGEDDRMSVGVSEDALIVAGDPRGDSPDRTVEYVIDTAAGDDRRYHEVDSDFEEVTDAVSDGDLMFLGTEEPADETNVERGRFENAVGFAMSADVDENESEVTHAIAFIDERDVFERDIEDWTREEDAFTLWRDIEVEANGRVVTIEGEIRTRDLLDATAL